MAGRQPKILWANPFCLLDLSSGASMAVRQQLLELKKRGYAVQILGATIFDSPAGLTRLKAHWQALQKSPRPVVNIKDPPLEYTLIKTKRTERGQMTAEEEARWYKRYIQLLERFKPDWVYYYGGRTLDLLIGDEARARGIPVVAYLANGNFKGKRWCRDVDLILTDSHATAGLYRDREGLDVTPIGAFIDPADVVAPKRAPANILLVNPSLAKGAAVVIRMAMLLEKSRPDIRFEVVQSRGSWQALLKEVSTQCGEPRRELSNVTLTPNTADMRPVYARARVLLALSLWWESFGRVAAEAAMNGIPVVITPRGGLPEAAGACGHPVDLPEKCYEPPYNNIPKNHALQPVIEQVCALYDRPATTPSAKEGLPNAHSIDQAADRLEAALASVRRAP